MQESVLIEAFLAELPKSRLPLAGSLPCSGDDCAVFALPRGKELAVSTDICVENVHFPAHTPPCAIGARGLASAVSDLAAMGAEPLGFTLAMTLSVACEDWIKGVAKGCGIVMTATNICCVGGDLSKGLLNSLCFTVFGAVPIGKLLSRSGARPGDIIFVSGTLGDARAGLSQFLSTGKEICAVPPEDSIDFLIWRFFYPQARIALGQKLLKISAHSAIDLSDGLYIDLHRILTASGWGAKIDPEKLPRSIALRNFESDSGIAAALGGGDDYELCFTVSPESVEEVLQIGSDLGVKVSQIGVVEAQDGIRFPKGFKITSEYAGYDHFS